MSILDDDVLEQAYEPIGTNMLKDVPIEDIPALIQAWYDVFYNAIVVEKQCGYQIYPLLCLYERCCPGLTYREFRGHVEIKHIPYVSIYNMTSRDQYINLWKQFMLRHVEDEIWSRMDVHFSEFFVALTGLFSCELLENGKFTGPYALVTLNPTNIISMKIIPSESYPEHKYLFYRDLIYSIFRDFKWQN